MYVLLRQYNIYFISTKRIMMVFFFLFNETNHFLCFYFNKISSGISLPIIYIPIYLACVCVSLINISSCTRVRKLDSGQPDRKYRSQNAHDFLCATTTLLFFNKSLWMTQYLIKSILYICISRDLRSCWKNYFYGKIPPPIGSKRF